VISKQFVELMGGNIQLASEINKGTTVTLDIKVKLVNKKEIETLKPQRQIIALSPNQAQYRILIVDDSEINRKLLVKLLQPLGFQVKEAENGQEAIKSWQNWQPHLIWMDIRMPIAIRNDS
jgi:PleD family two-component response regulator